MGAWGPGIFENDEANDFAHDIADNTGVAGLESALARCLGAGTDYLEAPDATEALAAADIVARMLGRPGDHSAYTDVIDDWVADYDTKPSPQLVEKARKAVARVRTEPSELIELWQESDEFESWKHAVDELAKRLEG